MVVTVLDFETAYGKHPVTGFNYTLSKQTCEEYVRSKYFKAHGLGVKIGKEKAFYLYKPADLLRFLKTHPWNKSYVICHHTHFDGAILSWRCGIRPAFWGCTLSMARAIFPHESSSLANVAKLLGVGEKGTELVHFNGKWTLTDQEQQIMGSYCMNDVELTADIFDALKGHFPASELRLIDWTVRAFTEPVIQVDPAPLVKAYITTRRTKRALIKQCVTDKTVLASSDKFAELLLTVGVDPPKKVSPSKVKDGRVDPDTLGDPPLGLLPSFKAWKGASVEDRAQLKEEKRTYPWAYAFGKADESFKLLQSHPDPKVQALVEARLGVKSTITETRTKRYYKIGKRGAFPVYLNYYGAHTNRWSGGDKQNAQNLSRVDADDPESGALRKSWLAPPGHVICVRDLGQIEARMLVYWAGQEDMVNMFRAGGDPYCFMATKIYGKTIVKTDKKERSIGKLTILGCFGPDTLVLTDRGWVSILLVKDTDMVWDGIEFVPHNGVINQGERECLTAFGVTATPDHGIRTEHSWVEWQSVLTNPSLFQSALRSANLPSSPGSPKAKDGSRWFDVRADGRVRLIGLILKRAGLRGAIRALRSKARRLASIIGGTPIFSQTTPIGRDYSTGSVAVYPGVTRSFGETNITAPEESLSTRHGGRVRLDGESSLFTFCHFLDGITRISKSTASTIAKAMSRVIFDSLLDRRTTQINGVSEPCKQKSMTYDIACAGPRNRFTIATTAGPLIVHNCGYQMGWAKFQESIRVGFMGMPGILFDQSYVDQLGVNVEGFRYQRSYRKGHQVCESQALAMKPLNLTDEEQVRHCAVTKHLIDTFRSSNDKVIELWGAAKNSLTFMLAGMNSPVGARPLVTATAEGYLLPNGMKIRYSKLRKNDAGEFKYLANVRKKEWTKLYAGKAVENVVQSLSRLVISEQKLNIISALKTFSLRKGEVLKVVTSTHDEIVVVAPERLAEGCLEMMRVEMATSPAWCADLPLKSSGGYARSYGDCEK